MNEKINSMMYAVFNWVFMPALTIFFGILLYAAYTDVATQSQRADECLAMIDRLSEELKAQQALTQKMASALIMAQDNMDLLHAAMDAHKTDTERYYWHLEQAIQNKPICAP